jgi:hypothetical protein
MPIDAGQVDIVLLYNEPITLLVPARSTTAQIRDREHTNQFLEEIQLRYPGGPPAALITNSVAAINALYTVHPRITPALVRAEISNQEVALLLPVTAPAGPPLGPPAAAPGAPVGPAARRAALLGRMRARRGSFTWREGRTADFTVWINHAAPFANPISEDATINCWEAVLVAGAESGVVTIAQLTGAYGAPNPDLAVFNLLTHAGTVTVNTANAPLANNIQPGDVIMIEWVGQNLHHVMVAATANPADYRQVEVLSLWGGLGGGIVARGKLIYLLPENVVFRYSTL